MAIVRWEPRREFPSIQNEMNRLFNTVFETPVAAGNGALRRWLPAMDVVDSGEQYVLRADLPGLSESDVTIEIQDRVLTVSGERKAEHETTGKGYRRVERAFGSFKRSLTLPEGIDESAVAAQFDRGVLEITIPKPVERQPRKIEIAATPKTLETETETPAAA